MALGGLAPSRPQAPPSLPALAINVLHMPQMQAHWARLHLSAVERGRDSNANSLSSLLPFLHASTPGYRRPANGCKPCNFCARLEWAPASTSREPRPVFHPHPPILVLVLVNQIPRCHSPRQYPFSPAPSHSLTPGRRHNQQLALPHLSQTKVSSPWLREGKGGVAVCCPHLSSSASSRPGKGCRRARLCSVARISPPLLRPVIALDKKIVQLHLAPCFLMSSSTHVSVP